MLAFGVGVLSAGCGAAELPGPAHAPQLSALLTSFAVLSDAAMANQTGTGLRPPAIIGGATGHARVLLWDEMRPPPQLPPPASGTVTTTIGGGIR